MSNNGSIQTVGYGQMPQIGPSHEENTVEENLINNVLPPELLYHIFGFLSPKGDAAAAQVCRLWNVIVTDLNDTSVTVFGADAWKQHLGLEIEGDIPPLSNDVFKKSRSIRRRLSGKEDAPSCTAILIPKGLTLNKLKGHLEKLGDQSSISKALDFVLGIIRQRLGDKSIEESYWVLITDDVIQETRTKSVEAQKEMIAKRTSSECELPAAMEVVASCVMHRIVSGKFLFSTGSTPWSLTHTQDTVPVQLAEGSAEESVIVGFGKNAQHPDKDALTVITGDYDTDPNNLGAAARMRLKNSAEVAMG